VAQDDDGVLEHPEFFIRGDAADLIRAPRECFQSGGRVFACGRDPYFPAWPDVLQLNAFQPGLRQAVIETLSDIADQCDGIRCDMAMLMLNDVFGSTWGARAGQRPATEYWIDVISAIKKAYPDFLFMAEAYWDLEWELQQQGFDYCYDKRLYDRLEHDNAESVRLHLCANLDYQGKLVRFIENHDEPRALSAFSPQKERAAAVIMTTIPGAKLFHEGQFEGRKVRLPVFLGRRPVEPANPDLQAFYRTLLRAASSEGLWSGRWQICDRTGWPDNQSCLNILSWCWAKEEERYLIIVNYVGESAQARIRVPWDELRGRTWRLSDALSGDTYDRSGDDMRDPGLYVDLAPWECHFFLFQYFIITDNPGPSRPSNTTKVL